MKILVLHGYLTNSKIIQHQMTYLSTILKYNFTFTDAPNVSIKKPYEINTKFFPSPYYQWYNDNDVTELNKSINHIKTLGKFKIAIIHKFLTTCREPHKNSETFRVLKSKRIDKERSYLFKWCLKNINTNFIEKIIMIVLLFLKNIKLIRK